MLVTTSMNKMVEFIGKEGNIQMHNYFEILISYFLTDFEINVFKLYYWNYLYIKIMLEWHQFELYNIVLK
jgi:TnpA family transposase